MSITSDTKDVHIVTRKHIISATSTYPDAAASLMAWLKIAEAARWTCFNDVRITFNTADLVDGFVIFNIAGNKYRLMTRMKWARESSMGHVFIRSVLTHTAYDNRKNCK